MPIPAITQHARTRCQQRGFKIEFLNLFVEFGEKFRRPGNKFEIRLTKKSKEKMGRDNRKRYAQQLDKLMRKAILWDPTENLVITVYPIC